MLAALVVVALLPAPDTAPTGLGDALPSLEHLLGTDHLGRDVATRLFAGLVHVARPALGAAIVGVGLGAAIGALAGWSGGVIESAARALAGSLSAIPGFILALLVLLTRGASPTSLALGVGLAAVAPSLLAVVDRIAALKQAEFVLAARAHGIPDARVLGWHLFAVGCRDLLVREARAAVAAVVVIDVTLAYLGDLGIAEPAASPGNMIAMAVRWGGENPLAWAAPAAAVLAVVGGSLQRGER
jgi:peptide/nickel transport system permease protein